MVAFQRWKAAQNELLTAIDNYITTTVALAASVAKPWGHFSSDPELEEAITSISLGRTAVLSKTYGIYESEVYFNRIRNRSKKRVPVSLLPLEIMTRIATLACRPGCSLNSALTIFDYPIRETHETLLAMTQVCTDWRRIVTNIPQLWSHIDITYRSQHVTGQSVVDHTYPWLKRARNVPLSVHISVKSHIQLDFWGMCSDVFPYLHSATSLCFGPAKRRDLFPKLLSFWMAFGKPGRVQTLAFLGAKGARVRVGLEGGPGFISREVSDLFLLPIRVLRLHNTYFGWDNLAYHGLVELQLGYLLDSVCPTIEQMVGILSACPELRILRLQNMTFWNHELVHYEPVPLKHLEVLDVTGLKPDGVAVLLPILAPGPGELSLRVNLTSRDDDSEALTAFFLRSNIVRLFLQGWERRRFHLARHLNPLKNLRVLVFDFNNDSEPMDGEQKLDVLIDPPNCDNAALCSSQWPQLRTLYLINGKISPDTVRSVVESCRIQKLRIASCHMDGLDEEVEQWLQSVVQDMRCDLGLDRRILVRDWYKHMW